MGLVPGPPPVPVAIRSPTRSRLGKRTTTPRTVYTPRPEVPRIRVGQRLSEPSRSFGPFGKGIEQLADAVSKHGNATSVRFYDELRRRRQAQ